MDEQTTLNILERIHAAYYQLPAAERRVADFVLQQYAQVQLMSITQLADECGTAEATISRFCRRMNLKGFNAFKIELAQYAASMAVSAGSEPPPATAHGTALEEARLACEAINQTIELLDPKSISRAVDLIEAAPQILCLGSGGSGILAAECAHLFSTVTGRFQAISDSHLQMSAVTTLAPDSVIILFSYSGATNTGLQLLNLARQKGVHSILITRYHKSPAAKLADVVLRCGSNEGPFQFGSVAAKIAQLMVTDLLYQEFVRRAPEQCQANIHAVAEALSDMHI